MKSNLPLLTALLVVPLAGLNAAESSAPCLMTWNIHRGVGSDGKMDLERIAAVIREEQPDAVVLQEVDQGTTRSKGVRQADELAKLLGWQVYFGKAIDFQGGEYGQAVLSKWPMSGKTHRLSEAGEARVAVAVQLSTAEESLTVVGVHLDAESAVRRKTEVIKLLDAVAKTQGKVIIAGDWNQVPEGEIATLLNAAGFVEVKKIGPAMTCPAANPTTEIDYFWSKGFTIAGQARVIDGKAASDHLPVVARWQKAGTSPTEPPSGSSARD